MKTEIIPVIHMLNDAQVNKNIDIVRESGVQKVFIINHVVDVKTLLKCSEQVKSNYPDLWVGVNMLGVDTKDAISQDFDFIDGLWCDQTIRPLDANLHRKFLGMFFGGLAFKYQPQPKNLEQASKDAILATDVATTSGIGTGKEADLSKVIAIREYLGDHPMAIASGVSKFNIAKYKGIVNYLLVASSITDKNEILIKDELHILQNMLK